MKRVLAILAATTFPVLTAMTVVSFAQQPQPATQDIVMVKQRVLQTQEGGVPAPPPPPGDFVFVTTEMNFGGKVVKNAPYSAQALTETTQTLGDGNRIVNKTTSSQYRDSEGRTRREQSIKMLGPLGDGGDPLQTIFINDPVAGVSYSLDSRTHVAHKSVPFKFTQKLAPGAGLPPGEGQHFEFKVEGPPETSVVVKTPPTASTAGVVAVAPGTPGEPSKGFRIETQTGVASTYFFRRGGSSDNVKEEQLGKQNIEGVDADGTRTTITIPAGEIGNERAIEIISEKWYSPELQMVVMTRHSDPRTGETTYRLTNINRTEPPKSLFEVPADYTIKEGPPLPPSIGPLPAKIRRPE
jgi:hypothetical protein